jgi:hypothetical protein
MIFMVFLKKMVTIAKENQLLKTEDGYVWAIETTDETPVSKLVFRGYSIQP